MRKFNKRRFTSTLSTSHVGSTSNGDSSHGGSNSHQEEQQDTFSVSRTQGNKRGKTMGKKTWFIADPEKRIRLELNTTEQAIGESSKKLASSMGVVAKMANLCPITYNDWRLCRKHFQRRIMDFVKERFIVSNPIEEKVILRTIGHAWNCHKTKLRGMIYEKDKDGKVHLKKSKEELLHADNVPSGVPMVQWVQFVNYWSSPLAMIIAEKHKKSRAHQNGKLHTNGSKSYARKRDEMEKEKKREIGAVEFFVETHTSKGGKMSDHASDVVERCNAILWASTQDNPDMSSTTRIELEDEVLQEVQGPDHPGRVRGAGKGPTPFTWRSAKRHYMSNKVERLETQLEILTKRDAERDILVKEMERRDAERDNQVKEMERRDAEREKRDAEREKRDAEREIQLKKMEKMIELMYRSSRA